MAIRFRKKYKSWQVYWNNPDTGKRESKTFATKEEAEKENALLKYQLRYERERFLGQEVSLSQPVQKTLEQVYLEYLREKQFTRSNLEAHRHKLRTALQLLGQMSIAEISKTDLERVKSVLLADTSLARATVATRLSALRTVMYYAHERGYCEHVDFPKIPNPQYQHFIPPSREELETLFAVASPHIQRIIVIGAFVGARVGECELLQLTWDDVDLERGLVRIHGSKKNESMPWREVPISASIMPLVRQWHEEDLEAGVQHLVSYGGKPVKSIKHAWRATLKRAGITRRIRPYDLRHAFATELVAAGVDVGTVAQLMGHSSPSMLLKHYQHVATSQKQRAIDSLPELHVPHHVPQGKHD